MPPCQPPRPLPLRPAQLGDDALAVGADELLLVAADVVDVDLAEAQAHVVLDVVEVLVEVGAGEDAVREVLDGDLLGQSGEVFGVSYVAFGEGHAAVGPLLDGLVLGLLLAAGPGDVELYHARHRGRVLVRPASALLELLHEHLYLLVRGADGDDPVAELAGPAALDRSRGRHIDGGRRLRAGAAPRA